MNIQHETIRSVYAIRMPEGILDEAIFLTREAAEEYGFRESEAAEVVTLEVQGS